MLIMPVKYLRNVDGQKKAESTVIVFKENIIDATEEMQLARLQEMGIDAIKIIKSNPLAEVIGVSFDKVDK